MEYIIHRHYLRNLARAAMFMYSGALTFLGSLATCFSLIRIAENYWDLGIRPFLADALLFYERIFHYPFELLARYLNIRIPENLWDLIIIWLSLSLIYARANRSLGRYIDRVAPPTVSPQSGLRFYQSTDFHDPEKRRRRRGILSALLIWMNIGFRRWNRFADSLFMRPKKVSFGAWPATLQDLIVALWAAPFLPFLLAYVLRFDDYIVKRQLTFPLDGTSMPSDDPDYRARCDYHVELSLRAFLVVQLMVIVVALLIALGG